MNAYNVDFAKMTITITADFAKRMNDPNSAAAAARRRPATCPSHTRRRDCPQTHGR